MCIVFESSGYYPASIGHAEESLARHVFQNDALFYYLSFLFYVGRYPRTATVYSLLWLVYRDSAHSPCFVYTRFKMAGQISLQADIGNASANALTILGAAQPLLKALSADNVSPLALLQAQALGGCFHSNGEWAAKLPDLLARAPSVRLERISAWIGWQKGDTASYMSRTSGGRTASLLCLFLGNLYSKERCGMLLYNLSNSILPRDERNASIAQLADINECLASKLSSLGFGNLLATHLTRIRQCFFATGSKIPSDLALIPTEETMTEFLIMLQKALQNEDLILSFTGSRGAGPLLASVMCLCPEDVVINVEGELVQQDQRCSILFSITQEHGQPYFCLESKLRNNSSDFRHRFVDTLGELDQMKNLRFEWPGWLSCCLSIAFSEAGARCENNVQQALANLIAASALTLGGDDLYKGYNKKKLPSEGLKALLGSEYRHRICKTLEVVLIEPTNINNPDLIASYLELKESVKLALPYDICTCGFCPGREPWGSYNRPRPGTNESKSLQQCQISRFWKALGNIVTFGFFSPLIKLNGDPSVHHILRHPLDLIGTAICAYYPRSTDMFISSVVGLDVLHACMLSFVGRQNLLQPGVQEGLPSMICRSSGSSTIFPSTLEYPSIQSHNWSVEYQLVDGKLHYETDIYSDITCTTGEKGAARKLRKRRKAKTSLLSGKAGLLITPPSGLGEHYGFTLTIRPDFFCGTRVLRLRSIVQTSSTQSVEVDFLDLHLGFLRLSRADKCEHYQRSPFENSDRAVAATSVAAPLPHDSNKLALTLTYWNTEAQFLCCMDEIPALYHAECCLPCAVAQARSQGIRLIIGGCC